MVRVMVRVRVMVMVAPIRSSLVLPLEVCRAHTHMFRVWSYPEAALILRGAGPKLDHEKKGGNPSVGLKIMVRQTGAMKADAAKAKEATEKELATKAAAAKKRLVEKSSKAKAAALAAAKRSTNPLVLSPIR